MTDDLEDRFCLVGLCAAEGVGPATVAVLQQAARGRRTTLRKIASWPADRLRHELALGAAAADAVAGAVDPVRAGRGLLDRLGPLGIAVVFAGHDDYPQDLARWLGTRAPPVLFTAGDASILRRQRFAIVGSRRPSRRAVAAVRRLAAGLAASGAAVVSGGADGVDMTAHLAAADAGGTVTVPAVGLARFRRQGMEVRHLVRKGWYALGQFGPESRWQAAHALMRNRTIVALSRAVVAFEPRDIGGTWHTGRWALRMRKPLFVVTAANRGATGRGLRRLVRLGAVALDPDRMPDAAELTRLAAEYRPSPCPDQTPLFAE